VSNVPPDSAGIYDVVVSNPAGSVTSAPAVLTVMSQLVEVVGVPLGSSDSRPLDNYGPLQPGHSSACGILGTSSWWLSLQPEDAGTLILETTDSGIDPIMAVYAGTNASELYYLGCDDNSAADGINCWYRLSTEPGKIYTVELDGVNGVQGRMQLGWRYGREPVMAVQPTSQTAQMGETVTFRVAADGVPPPNYQWQFNGKDLAGETSDTLVLPSVHLADAGQYRAMARNFIGAEASAAAQLTVDATVVFSSWEFEKGEFHFQITCPAGVTLEVDTSTDLRNWTPLLITNTPNGRIELVDPVAASCPQRFYRAQVY